MAVVPALVVGAFAWRYGISKDAVEPMLAAIAILTGVTFAMAALFWERSIAARHDPFTATNAARLNFIDYVRSFLVFTVVVGVIATALLMVVALFVDESAQMSGLVAALVAGFSIYEVTLVAASLLEFYRAAVKLRT